VTAPSIAASAASLARRSPGGVFGSPAAAVAGDAATLGAVSSDEAEEKRREADKQMHELLAEIGYKK